MHTMTTSEQRVDILRRLIDTRANGNVARFAREHSNHTTSLDPTYLRQLLNGHRSMGEKSARKLGLLLTGNPDYFDQPISGDFERAEYQAQTVSPIFATIRVPIIDNTEVAMLRDKYPSDAESVVFSDVAPDRRVYAMRLHDDSMHDPMASPTFPPGCIVIVDLDMTPVIGDYTIVTDASNVAHLRQLINDAGTRRLRPINRQYATLDAPIEADRYYGVAIQIRVDYALK
jgi:SOS-response transcriptional repressor LexA